MESKTTLQLYRNKVSIGDEEIYCNRLGAVILFQCRTNTLSLRLKWRQGFVGGAVDCPLCGAVEETGAFCHRVRGAGGGEGAVWSNPGGPSGIFLPGTELLQSPFRTEFSMGSRSRRYRRSLRHHRRFLRSYRDP